MRRLFGIVAVGSLLVTSYAPSASPVAADRVYTQADFAPMAEEMMREGDACLYVQQGASVVGEWYGNGFSSATQHSVMSFTKSLTATLVGIAQDRKLMKTTDKVSKYVPSWRKGPSKNITIENVLSMTTGRSDIGYGFLMGNRQYATQQSQVAPPGTQWAYNSSAVQVLELVLAKATQQSFSKFAKKNLFDPLGISGVLKTDFAGIPGLFIGWQATCSDAARIVELYLNGGVYKGRRVVSRAFVERALSPSSTLNQGYGWLWWLNRPGTVMNIGESPRQGKLMQAWPEETFWMQGVCHQFAVGVPSSKLIVVRLRANCWGAQAIATEQSTKTPTVNFVRLLGAVLSS